MKEIILLALFVIMVLKPAQADRGHWVLAPESVRANVSVKDKGQKAIIAWDGKNERLLLSTDLAASQEARVVEFLPLPSKPSAIELGDFKDFDAVQELINAHKPKFLTDSRSMSKGGLQGAGSEPGVKIVFHKKLGPHDFTVAQVSKLEDFMRWMRKFFAARKLEFNDSGSAALKSVVKSYLQSNVHYFVFDIIELKTATQSLQPVRYEFKSSYLYYPMVVSTLSTGISRIDLFTLTPRPVKAEQLASCGLKLAEYLTPVQQHRSYVLQFPLSAEELGSFSGLKQFFAGYTGAYQHTGPPVKLVYRYQGKELKPSAWDSCVTAGNTPEVRLMNVVTGSSLYVRGMDKEVRALNPDLRKLLEQGQAFGSVQATMLAKQAPVLAEALANMRQVRPEDTGVYFNALFFQGKVSELRRDLKLQP